MWKLWRGYPMRGTFNDKMCYFDWFADAVRRSVGRQVLCHKVRRASYERHLTSSILNRVRTNLLHVLLMSFAASESYSSPVVDGPLDSIKHVTRSKLSWNLILSLAWYNIHVAVFPSFIDVLTGRFAGSYCAWTPSVCCREKQPTILKWATRWP